MENKLIILSLDFQLIRKKIKLIYKNRFLLLA